MKSIGKSIVVLLALIVGAYILANIFNLLPEPSPQDKQKYIDAANEPVIDDDYWVEKGTNGIGFIVDKGEKGAKGIGKTLGNLGLSDAKRSLLFLMPLALILAVIFIIFLFFRIKRLQTVMGGVTTGILGLAGGMNQVAQSAHQVAGEAGAVAGASNSVEGQAEKVSGTLKRGTGFIALLLFILFVLILLFRAGFISNMITAWNEPSNTSIKYQPNSLPDDQEIEIIGEQEVPLNEDDLYLDSDYDSNRQLYNQFDDSMYKIQLGRFSDEPADLSLYTNLKHLGNVETKDIENTERVTLGRFYNRSAADRILNLVQESGFKDAFVIQESYPNTYGQYEEGTQGNLAAAEQGKAIRVGVFRQPPYHTLSALNDLGYMLFPPRKDGLVEVYLTDAAFNDDKHLNSVLQTVRERGFEDAFTTTGQDKAMNQKTLAAIGPGKAIRLGVFRQPPYHTLSSLDDLGYMLFPPRKDSLIAVYLTATEFKDHNHLHNTLQAVRTRGFEDAFTTDLKPTYYDAKVKKQQAGYMLQDTPQVATEYMVQLEAAEKPQLATYQSLSKYGNLYTEIDPNRSLTRVLLGPYFTESKADAVTQLVQRGGTSDAFIQRYNNTPQDNMRKKYRNLVYVARK